MLLNFVRGQKGFTALEFLLHFDLSLLYWDFVQSGTALSLSKKSVSTHQACAFPG